MAIVPLGFMRSETNEHMKEGKRKGYGSNMAGPVTYAWFYERVKYGGVWDYKTQSWSLENFGNFHYGAVGTAAGIPDSILCSRMCSVGSSIVNHLRWKLSGECAVW